MAFACAPCDIARSLLVEAAPGMPLDLWWVTAAVLFLLALTATIDAFTTLVPDGLIFLGLVAVAGLQGLFGSWMLAGVHLTQAILAGLIVWAINFAWYRKFHYDALGMGDAKWTALAVACFGALPALYAWGIGSCLAVAWILAARVARYQITRVTFAPFLFLGLVAGLYWLRFYL
ncbi:MAG: hypothetical protein P4M15_14950 [Alphaproteobacteria bacterium]|nr:hypothetical protein [Alphaproteobacteria bacterium]